MPQQLCQGESHLSIGQVSTDAVANPHRPGLIRPVVIILVRLFCLLQVPLGDELVRMRKVITGIVCPEVTDSDTRLAFISTAFGY